MADFTEDEFVHELLLILYHTKFRDKYLNSSAVNRIEKFIGMCRAKDRLDNSQTLFCSGELFIISKTDYQKANDVRKLG